MTRSDGRDLVIVVSLSSVRVVRARRVVALMQSEAGSDKLREVTRKVRAPLPCAGTEDRNLDSSGKRLRAAPLVVSGRIWSFVAGHHQGAAKERPNGSSSESAWR